MVFFNQILVYVQVIKILRSLGRKAQNHPVLKVGKELVAVE